MESGLLHCGLAVGLIRDVPSVQEIIEQTISDASWIIGRHHDLAGQ